MQEPQPRDKIFQFAKQNRLYLSCMESCYQNFYSALNTEEKVCLLKCNDRKSDLLSSNLGLYKNILLLNHEV